MKRSGKRLWWIVLATVIVFVIPTGYLSIEELELQPDTLAAVAGVVSAAASAVAALAAFGAARHSSQAAHDSSRALSLATKPEPDIQSDVRESATHQGRGRMEISVENLSQKPIIEAVLRWHLRDGAAGYIEVGNISGRTRPYGGMLHAPQDLRTFTVDNVDDTLPGVDRFQLEYGAELGPIRWVRTVRISYKLSDTARILRNGKSAPQPYVADKAWDEVELVRGARP